MNYSVKEFLTFTFNKGLNPLNISAIVFCAYLETLANKNLSPATIKNKTSHIRQWMTQLKGNLDGVYHDSVAKWHDALEKTSKFEPNPKEAVPIQVVKDVISLFPQDNIGWILRSAILLMSYGGFRQSEVMPPSIEEFDKEWHITRGDIQVHEKAIKIVIKKGKNLSKYDQRRICVFNKNTTPEYCVVFALNYMYSIQPTVNSDDPLFTYPVDNKPVCLPFLRKKWTEAIVHLKQDPKKYSLHSLRKMNATASYHAGVTEHEIRQFGAWSSSAHRQYISTRADLSVNKAISHYFK